MSDAEKNPERRIALFQRKEIRRAIHKNEWWFVVVDVVAALTDSANPTDYLNKIRQRDPELAKGYGQIVHPLSILTTGGPQKLNCANTEGMFRLIQSIPSLKAEPFKRWLARVGYERVQEIEDPELAIKRARALYQAKGYSDDWIEKRMRSIAIRDELTDEWKKRGVKEQREYAILTAEISKAAFGLTPAEYAEFKKLKREDLRDHMTCGGGRPACRRGRASCRPEKTSTLRRLKNLRATLGNSCASSAGLEARLYGRQDARRHTRNARRELEKKSGRRVVTSANYLALAPAAKKLKS